LHEIRYPEYEAIWDKYRRKVNNKKTLTAEMGFNWLSTEFNGGFWNHGNKALDSIKQRGFLA
jgi:hypothetical protein